MGQAMLLSLSVSPCWWLRHTIAKLVQPVKRSFNFQFHSPANGKELSVWGVFAIEDFSRREAGKLFKTQKRERKLDGKSIAESTARIADG